MSRREFTRKTKRAAIERAAGRCEKCSSVLKSGEAEVDHVLPSELGGEPTLANAQVLCGICHKQKTTTDVRRIRKGDRQRDKATGAIQAKQAIRSRGFPKTEKSSKRTAKAPLPPKQLYQESDWP